MKKGTYIYVEDAIQNLTFLNISHHLKITAECLKYLLNIIENELQPEHDTQSFFFGNDMAVKEIAGLCQINAELMESMNKLFSRWDLNEQENTGTNHWQAEFKPARVPSESCLEQISGSRNIFDMNELNQRFRESIVDLMSIALNCWEQCTRKNKIELAEESKVWRINIDGGRLRVRSMDRYLSLTKLPKAPRWRDVLKTAYFVLDHVEPDSTARRKLEESLEYTLRIVRLKSH
jgi:hypothetical protein